MGKNAHRAAEEDAAAVANRASRWSGSTRSTSLTACTPYLSVRIPSALADVGPTYHDVVKTTLYVVGLKPDHVPTLRAVRGRYINAEQPPASTLVGVSALVGVDWLIEIEAVAVLPE